MNWEIIRSNIAEAAEELETIDRWIDAGIDLSEEQLQVRLLHACHHLHFAWNVRRVSTARYAKLTDEQFKLWGSYPTDIETM